MNILNHLLSLFLQKRRTEGRFSTLNWECTIFDHKTRRDTEKLFPNRKKVTIITIIISNIYWNTAYFVCHCSTSFTSLTRSITITTLWNRDDADNSTEFAERETRHRKVKRFAPSLAVVKSWSQNAHQGPSDPQTHTSNYHTTLLPVV